jgi:hypothetical protein
LEEIKEVIESKLGEELDCCIRWDLWRFDCKNTCLSSVEPEATTYYCPKKDCFTIELNPKLIKCREQFVMASFLHEVGHILLGHLFLDDDEIQEDSEWHDREIEKQAECFVISKLGLELWIAISLVNEEPEAWIKEMIAKYKEESTQWSLGTTYLEGEKENEESIFGKK